MVYYFLMKTWDFPSVTQKVCERGSEKRWLRLPCMNRHAQNLLADTAQFTEVGWDAETLMVTCLGSVSCSLCGVKWWLMALSVLSSCRLLWPGL